MATDIDCLGLAIARSQYSSSILMVATAAVAAFIFLYAISIFMEQSTQVRKGRAIYLVTSFILFVASSVASMLESRRAFDLLLYSQRPRDIAMLSELMAPRDFATDTLIACYVAVGNALLLYRGYVIWSNTPSVVVLPGLTWLASIGTGFLHTFIDDPATRKATKGSSILLNFAVNTMLAILISFKLLRTRSRLAELIPVNVKPSMSLSSILGTLFIESGMPIAICGFGYAIAVLLPEEETNQRKEILWVARATLAVLYQSCALIIPQLIIFRIATGNSWIDASQIAITVTSSSVGKRRPVLLSSLDFSGDDGAIKSKELDNKPLPPRPEEGQT